jgi:hypothetical protein
MAPFGYLNKRDKENKPIIVLDPERAPVIKGIFERFLNGENMERLYI